MGQYISSFIVLCIVVGVIVFGLWWAGKLSTTTSGNTNPTTNTSGNTKTPTYGDTNIPTNNPSTTTMTIPDQYIFDYAYGDDPTNFSVTASTTDIAYDVTSVGSDRAAGTGWCSTINDTNHKTDEYIEVSCLPNGHTQYGRHVCAYRLEYFADHSQIPNHELHIQKENSTVWSRVSEGLAGTKSTILVILYPPVTATKYRLSFHSTYDTITPKTQHQYCLRRFVLYSGITLDQSPNVVYLTIGTQIFNLYDDWVGTNGLVDVTSNAMTITNQDKVDDVGRVYGFEVIYEPDNNRLKLKDTDTRLTITAKRPYLLQMQSFVTTPLLTGYISYTEANISHIDVQSTIDKQNNTSIPAFLAPDFNIEWRSNTDQIIKTTNTDNNTNPMTRLFTQLTITPLTYYPGPTSTNHIEDTMRKAAFAMQWSKHKYMFLKLRI